MTHKQNIPIVTIIILIGIITLSLIPQHTPYDNTETNNIDKVAHCFAYLCLAFSIVLFFDKRSNILALLILGIFLGIGIEFIQEMIPGRDKSLFDVIANTIGIVIGSRVGLILKSRIIEYSKGPGKRKILRYLLRN